MLVEELPISEKLKKILLDNGVKELYPPQIMAVKRGIFEGKNIILSSQTASGKTLLAEILSVENVLRGRGKSVYLTPLKALASEKLGDFGKYEPLKIKVALSVGDYDKSDPYLDYYDIIITTYEKMDSLLRHKPRWFRSVSTIIIDEIHYIDDPSRGPVLESLIAKIKTHRNDIQLVGLSATIGNPEELGAWLDAEVIQSDWRPVPLREGVFFRNKIIFSDGEEKSVPQRYGHAVYDLINDTLREDGQVLVFVNSRRRAVSLAETASKRMNIKHGIETKEIAISLLDSSDVPTLNKKLYEVVSRGIAFHHAGLSFQQRKIIEEAFREGYIKAIFATPTLSAGVNLPARRVVIEDYRRYSSLEGNIPIKILEYKQFAGRAGRPGYDEYGEAILIARASYEISKLIGYYINGEPEDIESKLGSPSSLRSHVLAYISTEGPLDIGKVIGFLKNSLYYLQGGKHRLPKLVGVVVDFLMKNRFIEENEVGLLRATFVGKRVSEVYVDPLSAVVLIKGIKKRETPTIFGLLNLISMTPDMPKLPVKKREMEYLEEVLDERYPEVLLGYEDRVYVDFETILSEIKTTMFLYDWINEVPEQTITEKYDIGPGDVRSLIDSAEWIAYAFRRIVEILPGEANKVSILKKLEKRIRYGVKEELLALTEIRDVGRVRARKLFMNGFKSIEEIALATPERLSRIEGIGIELARKIITNARELLEKRISDIV